jgi:hypothetical protein
MKNPPASAQGGMGKSMADTRMRSRYRQALETALGDPAMLRPLYAAYLQIVAVYGEEPDLADLLPLERVHLAQWLAVQRQAQRMLQPAENDAL